MKNAIIHSVIQQRGLVTNINVDLAPLGSLHFCENVDVKKPGVLSNRYGFKEFFSLAKIKPNENNGVIKSDDTENLFYSKSNKGLRNPITGDLEKFIEVVSHDETFLAFTTGGLFEINLKGELLSGVLRDWNKFFGNDGKSALQYTFFGGVFYFFIGDQYLQSYVPNKKKNILNDEVAEQRITVRQAALPRASHPHLTELVAETKEQEGWLPAGSEVAYRAVWKTKNPAGLTIRGAPSNRVTVKNTTQSKVNVCFDIPLPTSVYQGDVLELYRSAIFKSPTREEQSLGVYESADDELALVAEIELKNIGKDDSVINVADYRKSRGQLLLYSSPSQEGAQGENISPPVAKVLSRWKNSFVYANLKSKVKAFLTVNDLSKLALGDTMVFSCRSPFSIVAALNEDLQRTFFRLYPQPENTEKENGEDENFQWELYHAERQTLYSLAHIANATLENRSLQLSVVEDGEKVSLLIQSEIAGDDVSIYFKSGNENEDNELAKLRLEAVFNPKVGVGEEEGLPLESVSRPNRIIFSKPHYPEATTLSSFIDVGDQKKEILAVHEVGGYLYIFKEEGVYRLSGFRASEMTVVKVDASIRLLGKKATAIFEGELYAFTTKGVLIIGYGKLINLSKNIDNLLNEKHGWENIKNSRLVADTMGTRLLLLTPASKVDKTLSEVYVYHGHSSEWTRWHAPYLAMGISPKQILFAFDKFSLQYQSTKNDELSFMDNVRSVPIADAVAYQNIDSKFGQSNKDDKTDSIQLEGDELIEVLEEGAVFITEFRELDALAGEKQLEIKNRISISIPHFMFKNFDSFENSERILESGKKLLGIALLIDSLEEDKLMLLDHDRELISSDMLIQKYISNGKILVVFKLDALNEKAKRWIDKAQENPFWLAHRFRRFFCFNKLWVGNRHELKNLVQIDANFNNTTVQGVVLGLSTDISTTLDKYPLKLKYSSLGYGEEEFGLESYGGNKEGDASLRVSVPRDKRLNRSVSLTIENNSHKQSMEMTSLTLTYDDALDVMK